MNAVGFPGMPNLVVLARVVLHFIVDEIQDGRHLVKQNSCQTFLLSF